MIIHLALVTFAPGAAPPCLVWLVGWFLLTQQGYFFGWLFMLGAAQSEAVVCFLHWPCRQIFALC
jgi:hypothetical protein